MSIRLSTAGISLKYAVETASGVRPTTGYLTIPEVKEIPEINPEPSTLDTTTLAETEYRTYINGLKDLGGALAILANLTQDSKDAWDTLYQSYVTAKADNKSVWFMVDIPDIDEACYFTGEPSPIGVPGAAVDGVLEINLYVTPTNAPSWDEKTVVSI